jgi:hypothetical protein
MFDVYPNGRRDLLVLRGGVPIPPGDASGGWRKRKSEVTSGSEEIGQAIQRHGYYKRKLRDFRKS